MRRPRSPRSRRAISGIGSLVLVGLLVALATGEASDADRDNGSGADHASATSLLAVTHNREVASGQPCGTRSAATVASVDTQVAQRIYADELAGRETLADQAHVRQSQALLSALSSGNSSAVAAAVRAIVYTPHWHIVRLRVLRAGRVLADVGGPYVIAPVTGTLKQRGRTLGRYVMSVQDDTGYVKLLSRFIGVPVELYRGRSPLMGTAHAPARPPAAGSPRRSRAPRLPGAGLHRHQLPRWCAQRGPARANALALALVGGLPAAARRYLGLGGDAHRRPSAAALRPLPGLRGGGPGRQRRRGVRAFRGARDRRGQAPPAPTPRRQRADRRSHPVGVLLAGGPAGTRVRPGAGLSTARPWRRARRAPAEPVESGLSGRVAQWESARFTRERSQVRNPPRPLGS